MEGIRLSPEQMHRWRLESAHRSQSVNQLGVTVQGNLDLDEARDRLNVLVRDQEILSTRIVSVPGLRDPLQVLGEINDVQLQVHSITENAVERKSTLEGFRGAIESSGSPWRVDLLKCETSCELVVSALSLILDMESMRMLAEHVLGNRIIETDEDKLQFADISEWQRELLDESQDSATFEEWRSRLTQFSVHADPDLGMTGRLDEGVAQSSSETITLANDHVSAIEWRESPASFCRAIWISMLAKVANADSLPFVLEIPGRHRPEFEGVLGPFRRQLPCIVSVDRDKNLAATISSINAQIDAQSHAVDFLPASFSEGKPRPGTSFGFVDYGGDTTADASTFDGPFPGCAAILRVMTNESGISFNVLFDPQVCTHDFANLLAFRVKHCIEAWESSPASPWREVNAVSVEEKQQIQELLCGETQALPETTVLHSILEHCRSAPESNAVVCGDTQMTYTQLESQAAVIKAELIRRTPTTGNVVIVGRRSAGYIAAMIGTGAAGYAYIPVDPGYPEERIRYIIENSKAVAVISDESCTARIDSDIPVLSFGGVGLAGGVADVGDGTLMIDADLESAAYLIYTSGSTGLPKGVRISHRNLQYSTQARLTEYKGDLRAFLVPTSFAFDSSVAGIYWTLASGGTLVLPEMGYEADAQALGELIGTYGVTHTLMLPSLYEAVLRTSARETLNSLSMAIVAGEECPISVAERHFSMMPDTKLFNEYGPTEATVWCTVYQIRPNDKGRLSIGHAIPGTSLHILDEEMRHVPLGAIGELYVASPGVAAGYWLQDELTEARFSDDKKFGDRGYGVYKTGDLVRLNDNSLIEFHGRVDRQVKIRGYRIELEEIESVLRRQSGVTAVAVATQEINDSKELVAYFVNEDGTVDEATLLDAIKSELPSQFLPKAINRLASIPLMPNGKIDYTALPAVAAEFSRKSSGYKSPGDAVEQQLYDIYKQVLNSDTKFGVDDGFFEIGGHSILATIAVAKIRERFTIEMPIRMLFDSPTISALRHALADRIGEAAGHSSANTQVGDTTSAIEPRQNRDVGTLSAMQAGIWYLTQLEPDVPAYNLQCGFRFYGKIDVEALQRAIGQVVNQHPALRSDIQVDNDGQPFARIQEKVEVPFSVVELEGEAELKGFLRDAATTPVATDCAPLLRATVLKIDDQRYALVLVFHHIVVEGWSVNIFLTNVSRAYASFVECKPIELAAEVIDYWDWNAHEEARLQPENIVEQLSYWKSKISGKPEQLEFARRQSDVKTRGGMVGRNLPSDLIKSLESIGRESGATLFVVMLAAYQALLHRYTGQTDVRVGTPINTRTLQELERTIGLFINTLVIRTETRSEQTFRDQLLRTQDDVLDAFSNMDAPLDLVSRSLDGQEGRTANRAFQVMFALQNAPPVALELSGVETVAFGHDELHSGAGKVNLSLVIEPKADDYDAWIEYDGGVFDQDRAERFIEHFEQLLIDIVKSPDKKIAELNLMTDDERQLVLEKFNETTVDFNARVAIERVWEQIERNPDKLAVEHLGRSLSYSQLGDIARQMAAVIRERDIPQGAVIAVCMRRCPEIVGVLLGSHLAGCGYVPIDPDYPDERIAYILEDSGAALLVTDSPQRFSSDMIDCVDYATVAQSALVDIQPAQWPSADDIAYIVYTSGSTGTPKGVRIKQRGLSCLIDWEERAYSVTANDRMTMIAGLGFDATVWELWPCLAVGASLYQVDDDKRSDPVHIYQWLVEKQITISFLPTPLAEVVLDLAVPAEISLRYMFTGGDALHARQWRQLPFSVVNHYGPSENTVVATAGAVPADLPPNVAPHIGRPIDNTRCYILDANCQPVPLGVVGELCLAGPAVADGYQNNDNLTARQFVSNPFADGHWSTLYKTGDRAYFNNDGTIEFLGRIDDQVKIRGFRIELGDIESALARHESIAQAAASVWTVNRDDKRVVAHVVPANAGEEINQISIRKHLRAHLPAYMVPTHFVTLDALPQTSNGKLDRAALQTPRDVNLVTAEELPVTETEKALAEIWREILGATSIDRHANYFDIGGNSLSAMKVLSRSSTRLGVTIPLRAVVLDSLFQIAAFCDQQIAAVDTSKPGGLRRALSAIIGDGAKG